MARAKKSKPTAAVPFWKRLTPGERVGAVLAVLAIVVGVPSFCKDCRGNQESEVIELVETNPSPNPDPGCGFPAHFVRDTLYVLITRFEDTPKKGAGNPYGMGIERRIDILSDSLRLPIIFCYREELSPNQRRDADDLRDRFHADLVIWGKLKNASPKCSTDGFCLQFEPSDTLITYAGGTVSKPKLDDYQYGISADNFETELIRMGNEIFDDWLVGMFNLKIGKRKPELFVIGEGWDNKKKAEGYLTRAGIWYGLGHYVEAISDYDQAIAINPKVAEAWLIRRGSIKGMLGRRSEAIADYDHAIAINPNDAGAYLMRGATKGIIGRHAEAIADFTQALVIDPKDAQAYCNRGTAKSQLGRYDEAIADYDKAIAIDPKYASAYCNRGRTKVDLGHLTEAISDFDHAIEINPKDFHSYYDRGTNKFHLGRYAEAIVDLDHSIKLDSKFAPSYNNRGSSKFKLGRYAEAIGDFKQSIVLDPQKQTYLNLELAHQRLLEKNKEHRRYYALAFLFSVLVYAWKFKTINRFLRRLFILFSQALKKLLRRT